MRSHAFTLIEIVIVVAIVALLAVITTSTIGLVRELARRASCANNLRQWGQALGAYAQDHRGVVPETACSEGGSRVPPLIWTTSAPSWSPDDLTWAKIDDYLTTTGSTLEAGSARLRGSWYCPSATWTKQSIRATNVGLNPEFIQCGYAYYARSERWHPLNVVTPTSALTGRRLEADRLLMADAMYALFDGRYLPVSHTVSRAGVGGQRADLAGINRVFGDGRVVWKGRSEFDMPAFLVMSPTQQGLVQSELMKFFNF